MLTWVGWGIGPIGLLVLNAQMMVAGGWVQALGDRHLGAGGRQHDRRADVAMIPLGLVLMT